MQKGIVLAGGAGTRLYPVTKVVSKQLLPIYNKPMIYYPLSTLINAGIKEIMIISTPEDQMLFKRLLGDGSQWKVNFEYIIQEKPEGIAQALILAESWLKGSPVTLILGDNLFFGPNMSNPGRFGVVNFDNDFNAISIEEKPLNPKSNWAVTGLYVFNDEAVGFTKSLKKSDRSEYEITDLNKIYLENKKLKVVLLDDTFSWLDTGTHESLLEASNFVRNIEFKNEISVADLEVL